MTPEKPKTGLAPGKTGAQILDMYYLEARSHLLETAAILDRIQRAAAQSGQSGEVMKDPRIKRLFRICDILSRPETDRARDVLDMLSVS